MFSDGYNDSNRVVYGMGYIQMLFQLVGGGLAAGVYRFVRQTEEAGPRTMLLVDEEGSDE